MKTLNLLLCAGLLSISTISCAKPPPKTIDELLSEKRHVSLELVGVVRGGPGFTSQLYSYNSAGLKVHALVATPVGKIPEAGFPVLVANHGHHPEPPKYGISADGNNWRPGDYYRKIPELYTALGYVVVMADFRGHNDSEGFEYTEGMLESAYYTEDVLNLLDAVDDLTQIDAENIFMWGHSMGGEVTLRTLLATGKIKAASLWSSVGGDIWDQSYYYSRYENPAAPDSSSMDKYVITRLLGRIKNLDGEFDTNSVEPLRHLDYLETPVIIHHSFGDRGAAFKWSEQLAKELYMAGKQYEFWIYPGDEHLFPDDVMALAVARDHQFFRANSQ
jgi:dipeptidyl aminopeptidase/acylaminoacyl peptidase